MISESLLEVLRDENFASPYGKNHSSDDVLSLQPVEKVMFVYKLLAALDSDFTDSSEEYAASAQFLFERLDMPSVMVPGFLKARPEEKHFWNVVTIDGYSFHFDAYFAHPESLKALKVEPFLIDDLAYNFFCASTSRISQTHVIGEDFPSVDCPHNLSRVLVRDLASMGVWIRLRIPMKLSGIMPPKPVSPLRINYTAATTPITLSFE